MQTDILAVDFGTSNTAAAIFDGETLRHIPIEAGAQTLPTAVFFPEDGGPMRIGAEAVRALVAGEEGRFMRALKSVLGTPLLHESRLIAGRRRVLADIVAAFLRETRKRAEAQSGRVFRRVLSGRPVRFHSADPDADAQAEADLRACYHAAGFEEVAFLPEPEAAAIASQRLGTAGGLGLIVDIGGGTSDFSAFRTGDGRPEILASHGIRLGGTDFDQALSLAHVMPLLGLGGDLRREMGPGLLPVPRAVFVDLSTWARIPFLYTPETRRMVTQMHRLAVDPATLGRLAAVLDLELGHEVAFEVERGKIDANAGRGRIDLGAVSPGLEVVLGAGDLGQVLRRDRTQLFEAAQQTLTLSNVRPDSVSRLILVGGSSLMGFVADTMSELCPAAEVLRAQAFTAVVDGLAIAARDGFPG
ncbi:MAG: Hsp70 family protein [Jannaschia sp.]